MDKLKTTSATVAFSEIKVPAGFNVRSRVEKLEEHKASIDTETGKACCHAHSIEHLAADIRRNGLLTPPIVKRAKKGFELIAGFRRLEAIGMLKWKEVPVTIHEEMTEEQAYLTNLLENLSRENLSAYDIAARCTEFKKRFGWSGEAIAAKVGKTKGYVNNLMRCYEALDAKILEAWKNGDKRAKTDALNTLARLDKKEQVAQWEATAEKDSKAKPEGTVKAPKSRSRDVLAHAFAVVEKANMHAKAKEGAMAALAFAMGDSDLILGMSVKPEGKLPKEAREAVEAQALADGELAENEADGLDG